jgi:hypothetical protein
MGGSRRPTIVEQPVAEGPSQTNAVMLSTAAMMPPLWETAGEARCIQAII